VIDWAARAHAILEKGQNCAPKTPATGFLGVLGVLAPASKENDEVILGVLGGTRLRLSEKLDAKTLTADLLEVAMRRCDEFGDGPVAREQMRSDIQGTPAHLQADLLKHLRSVGGGVASHADELPAA